MKMNDDAVKKSGEDMATTMNDEKPEPLTRFGTYCERFGINPNLVMLKVTLFVMYGATASLLPYLTIHMRSIGLTVPEISFVYLALPFTTFLSPPITGFLVDKFGQYKPVVIIALILNAIFHHSLLMIPHQETPGVIPSAYVMRHPTTGTIEIWWSPCPSRECPEEEEIDMVLDRCVDHCLMRDTERLAQSTTQTPPQDPGDEDDLNIHLKKTKVANGNGLNGKKKQTHLKRDDHLLDPITNETITLPNIINITDFNVTDDIEEPYNDVAFFLINMHDDLGEPVEQLGMEMEQDDNDTVTEFRQRFGEKMLLDSGVNLTALDEEDLRCGGMVRASNLTLTSKQRLSEWAADCMVQKCDFRKGGPEICPPDYKESDDRTFWIYFLLRFMGTIMLSSGVTIMDPIALTMIQKYGGDFGRERLFSSIGMAIFSPITGMLIDMRSKQVGYTDYSAAFYTYDVLLLISAVTVLMMPLGAKLPADNLFRDLVNLIKMPHVIIFIFFLFVLGNFWGFIESYLFLYLKELGAPNFLLGITVTVGTLSSIPFLYGADTITSKVGHVNVIIIAFFSHAARLVGYSFIENSWWCFPFEAMESLSVHLMWVAAATYCAMLAPKNLLATLIGVLGMAHFSLGRGSGSFFGGILIATLGTRVAFFFMGMVAIIGGIWYAVLHFFWLRKVQVANVEQEDSYAEHGETDKLNAEPLTKEQGTMMSTERLHMMIDYNPIGSLTSLPRGSRVRLSQGDINELYRSRSNSTRRSSNVEISNKTTPRGSASKVDLLKSALEINHHHHNHQQQQQHNHHNARNNTSNPALSIGKNGDRNSNHKLTRSAPKLNQKNISQPTLPALLDLESRMNTRRDSIPEEIEEERLVHMTNQRKIAERTNSSNIPATKTDKKSEHRKSWHSDDNNPT